MKLRFAAFLLILFLCSSCSVNYYICETNTKTTTFYKRTTQGAKLITIPKGEKIIVKGKSKYRLIKYNDTIGWAYIPSLKNERKYNYKGSFKITKRKKKKKNPSNYSGGTVYVKGYYRKDGTYVRPHTRKKRN